MIMSYIIHMCQMQFTDYQPIDMDNHEKYK
jgi:hypothetical protein